MDSASFPPAPRDLGRILGDRYELLSSCGHGSFATVYRARDSRLDAMIAVKLLHREHARSADLRRRFVNEAKLLARFDHPHIVRVFDIGEDERQPYFVMPLLTGDTLRTLINRQLPGCTLPWKACTSIAIQLLLALEALHERNVLHRDLKPANAIVSSVRHRGSTVTLIDLGLAKATPSDPSAPVPELGAPAYRAPERWDGEAADARSDIYSLGAIYYQLLTGVKPFQGEDMKRQHQEAPPIPPRIRAPRAQIPESIEALVLRALAKAPGDRFASATAFLVALEAEHERLVLQLPPGYHLVSRALAGPERPANHEPPVSTTTEAPAPAPTPGPAPAKPGPLRIRSFAAGLFGGAAVSLAVSGALRSQQEPPAPAAEPVVRADATGRGTEEPAPVAAPPRSEQMPADARERPDEIEAPRPAPPGHRPPGRPPARAARVDPEADATRLLDGARPKMRACPGHPASFSTRVQIARGKARVLEIDGYEVDPSDPWQPCVRAVIESVVFGTHDLLLQTRVGLQ